MSSEEEKKPAPTGGLVDLSAEIFGDDDLSTLYSAVEENLENMDLRISRLALCQPMTPEVAKAKTHVEGQMMDSVTKAILSTHAKGPWMLKNKAIDPENVQKSHFCRIVPVCILPKEYVKWKDRNTEGTGMHWKSLDKTEQRVREGIYKNRGGLFDPPKDAASKKPPVTENINVLCLIVDEKWMPTSDFIVITFSKTSMKAGSRLLDFLARHKMQKLPAWGYTYYLVSELGTPRPGQNDTFYKWNIVQGDSIKSVEQELLPNVKALHETCKEIALKLTDKEPMPGSDMTKGRFMQEMYINAAALVEDDTDDEGDGEDAIEGEVTTDVTF